MPLHHDAKKKSYAFTITTILLKGGAACCLCCCFESANCVDAVYPSAFVEGKTITMDKPF